MSHTYTQKKITQKEDLITVEGAVDGINVVVSFWASHVIDMDNESKIAYVASLMLAEMQLQTPIDLTTLFPSEIIL